MSLFERAAIYFCVQAQWFSVSSNFTRQTDNRRNFLGFFDATIETIDLTILCFAPDSFGKFLY